MCLVEPNRMDLNITAYIMNGLMSYPEQQNCAAKWSGQMIGMIEIAICSHFRKPF